MVVEILAALQCSSSRSPARPPGDATSNGSQNAAVARPHAPGAGRSPRETAPESETAGMPGAAPPAPDVDGALPAALEVPDPEMPSLPAAAPLESVDDTEPEQAVMANKPIENERHCFMRASISPEKIETGDSKDTTLDFIVAPKYIH